MKTEESPHALYDWEGRDYWSLIFGANLYIGYKTLAEGPTPEQIEASQKIIQKTHGVAQGIFNFLPVDAAQRSRIKGILQLCYIPTFFCAAIKLFSEFFYYPIHNTWQKMQFASAVEHVDLTNTRYNKELQNIAYYVVECGLDLTLVLADDKYKAKRAEIYLAAAEQPGLEDSQIESDQEKYTTLLEKAAAEGSLKAERTLNLDKKKKEYLKEEIKLNDLIQEKNNLFGKKEEARKNSFTLRSSKTEVNSNELIEKYQKLKKEYDELVSNIEKLYISLSPLQKEIYKLQILLDKGVNQTDLTVKALVGDETKFNRILDNFTPDMIKAIGGIDAVMNLPIVEGISSMNQKDLLALLKAPIMIYFGKRSVDIGLVFFLVKDVCPKDQGEHIVSICPQVLRRSTNGEGWQNPIYGNPELTLQGTEMKDGSIAERFMTEKIDRLVKGEPVGLLKKYEGCVAFKTEDLDPPSDAYLKDMNKDVALQIYMDSTAVVYETNPKKGFPDIVLVDPKIGKEQILDKLGVPKDAKYTVEFEAVG